MSARHPPEKVLSIQMTRSRTRRTDGAGITGRQVSSLLPGSPDVRHAAPFIAPDSAAGVACWCFCSAVLTQALPQGYVDYWHMRPARAAPGGDVVGAAMRCNDPPPARRVGTAYGTLTQLQPPATPGVFLAREAHRPRVLLA